MAKKKIKARRKPKAAFYIFSLVAMLTLLAAANSGVNLLYILFGGLLSFILLSYFLGKRNLSGVEAVREVPHAVHRGEPCPVTVRIDNPRRWLPMVAIRIERLAPVEGPSGFVLYVPPRRSVLARLTWEFPRRGVYTLPRLTLRSGFPFGLLDTSVELGQETDIVIYPRVTAVRATGLEFSPGLADRPHLAHVDGTEYFSLRGYIPGDDIRHIAWRASARLGSLVVRELEHETSRFVVILFDTRRTSPLDDFEDLFEDIVDMVASLATVLLNRYFSVAIITPDHYVPEGEGKSQMLRILDTLAQVQPLPESYPMDIFDERTVFDGRRAAMIHVNADPRTWGRPVPKGSGRYLDPRETLRA